MFAIPVATTSRSLHARSSEPTVKHSFPAPPAEAGLDRLVDLVERKDRTELRPQFQPSRPDMVDEDRQRDRGILRAVDRPGQVPLTPDEVDRVEVEPLPRRRQADDHART